jgi:ABC-type glycerol-3-phosphate transport system permease component
VSRRIALLAFCVVAIAPFLYVVSTSLKESRVLFDYPPHWIPSHPYLGNYDKLVTQYPFARWVANTLFVASVVTGVKLLIDSMAAYALARMAFGGRRLVLGAMGATILIPPALLLIPLFFLVRDAGLLDTYWALILPALANPLGVFLMRQFILGLPSDLMNAARLDGMSEFSIYWRIVLPLIKPGLVVLAVIIFTDQYISFIWPLIATTSNNMELLTVGVANLHARGGVNFGLWSASAVMSLVPIAIVFFALQRQFMSRSLTGALKQ